MEQNQSNTAQNAPLAQKNTPTALPSLNLPPYETRLREEEGAVQIFDELRGRYVALTPEEWVRQHFVHMLISEMDYPRGLMGNEVQLELNGMSRRCDTVVYDQRLRPRMIVEYKRPSVAITQKVFDQIGRYNQVMRVAYLLVSNGLEHYCCRMDYEHQTCTFLDHIPRFAEIIA